MFKTFRLFFYILLAPLFIGTSCNGQESIRFKIESDYASTIEQPIFMGLIDFEIKEWSKFELLGNKEGVLIQVPFQIENDQLVFLHSKDFTEYILRNGNKETTDSKFTINKENGDLIISRAGNKHLTYRYGMKYPPKGVDSIYGKSGYIHPLLSPQGDTLTRIQPPDHFHHYGIWGPWTHTQIKGKRVDFWNLGDRKGTVLFKEFNSTSSGAVFANFNATQEHIDFITEDSAQIALNEKLDVKLWNLERPDRYMFDYRTSFNSPLKEGILFEAYRYGGGIGMRFNKRWHKDNCSVLTSEGQDRLTADGTNAKWCIVKGESSDGKGTNGILFLSHPENRMHPEPMRIWPIDGNHGRGDMFFEFCPIRHKEWNIEPNRDYQLNYRMIVFEGDLNAEEAEAYWQTFAIKPEFEIIQEK